MADKREELYNNLLKTGKVGPTEIGTLGQFRAAIKDESTAKAFHKNLSGIFSADEIGDESAFVGSLKSDFAPASPMQQPQKQNFSIVPEVTFPISFPSASTTK